MPLDALNGAYLSLNCYETRICSIHPVMLTYHSSCLLFVFRRMAAFEWSDWMFADFLAEAL